MAHRFEQQRRTPRQRLRHRGAARHAERDFRAVDAVIRSVDQRDRDIDHRKTERTFFHRVADTRLDRRYPLFGDDAAGDPVFEAEAFAARQRTNLDDAIAILAVTARLFFVTAALGRAFADRFLVGDARRLGIDRDAVPAVELGEGDGQMLVIDTAQ